MDAKLKMLYEKVIDKGINFTTHDLNMWGYNAKAIKELIELGMIKRIKRGYYEFINVKDLYKYGVDFWHDDKELAKNCFRRCLEIDAKHQLAAYNLFFSEVYAGNYENAVQFLDILIEENNQKYQKDYNCYLYLLSFLIDLPEKYQQLVDNMEVQDLLVDADDRRYNDKEKMNEIRGAIFNGKWSYASKNLYIMKTGLSVDFVLGRLLHDVQNKMIDTLKYLWEQGEYRDFIGLLELKQDRYSLNRLEFIYLYLARTYVNILETRVISSKKKIEDGTIFDYINANDFAKALEIDKKQKINPLLNMLLTDICNLIKTIQESEKKEVAKPDLVTILLNALLSGNMPLVNEVLQRYLQDIHKEEYFEFILNHIRLCQLENDLSFIEPMHILAKLKNDTFSVDLEYYNELLQYYVKKNNWEAGKLVAEMLGFLMKKSGDFKERVGDTENKGEELDFYLQVKYNELMRDKGLVLLDPMDAQERLKVIEQVKNLPDIMWFTIGDVEPKRLVLHYVPELREYVDLKTLLKNLRYKYNKKKYREVIADCLLILQFKKVKSYPCFRIGVAYGHIGEYQKANDYLLIAQELSKKDQTRAYDFSHLYSIFHDFSYQGRNAIKTYVNVELQEFEEQDVDKEFMTIKEAVLIDGMDAKSICQHFGYDRDQIGRVLILLAKECYMIKNMERGDNYIKEFERMAGKSRSNIDLMEEVKRNKKIYANQGNSLVRTKSEQNGNN